MNTDEKILIEIVETLYTIDYVEFISSMQG